MSGECRFFFGLVVIAGLLKEAEFAFVRVGCHSGGVDPIRASTRSGLVIVRRMEFRRLELCT
jgi:hypothetical protein